MRILFSSFSLMMVLALGCGNVDTNEEPAAASDDDDDDGSYALTSGTFSPSGLHTIADGCGVGDQITMEPMAITVQGNTVDIGGMPGTLSGNDVDAETTEPLDVDPACPMLVRGVFEGTLVADDEIDSVMTIGLELASQAPAGCAAECQTTIGFHLAK